MFQHAFARHGTPRAVHADSGPAMRSNALKDLLADVGVDQTHNRPRVSNDNPFSESEFRTMKYRPNYPGTFDDLDHARTHMATYVPWYNGQHKHSGIALFSPDQVHDGTWRHALEPTRPNTTGLLRPPSRAIPTPPPNTRHPPESSASTSPNHDTQADSQRLHAA